MVVYVEYAFAENFLLDGLLLYLALKCARGRVRALPLAAAAAVGAAEAVAFPLVSLPDVAAYFVKALGGVLIAVIAVSKGTRRTFLVTAAAFFLLTFALGGALVAAYSFFGAEYTEENGYLVAHAPAGLVFAAAGIFALLVARGARAFYRYCRVKRALFACTLSQGERTVRWTGFADSGNCLFFRGRPVCVVSAAAIFALFGGGAERAGYVEISTVNGCRASPVFVCERMEVCGREERDVCLAVGDVRAGDYQMILHTAYLGGSHETLEHCEKSARKIGGKRERRSLSVRK